jgi:murein DD-endopeptidase MepM/ murein hydrolase activator NlpD
LRRNQPENVLDCIVNDIIATQHVARRKRPQIPVTASACRNGNVPTVELLIARQKVRRSRDNAGLAAAARRLASAFLRTSPGTRNAPDMAAAGTAAFPDSVPSRYNPPVSAGLQINNIGAEPRDMLFSCGVELGFNPFMTAAERGPQVRRGIKPSPRIKKILPVSGGLVLALILGTLIFIQLLLPIPRPPAGTAPLRRFGQESAAESEEWDELPLDMTETFSWGDYTVRPGDTVEGIAKNFGLSLDAVIASNNIGNVRRGLLAGSRIRVPNMDGIPYTVQQGDSYPGIASSMKVPLEAVLDANDVQTDEVRPGTVLFIPGAKMRQEDLRLALGELFVFPVRGRITSSFGWRVDPFTRTRLFHAGMDLASGMGTPVRAAAGGRVSATGYNAVYGNFVILTHNNTYQTMYAHLSSILAAKGNYVGQGEAVGRVGSTGRSTGPHLHFAVYKNSKAINPLEILNK